MEFRNPDGSPRLVDYSIHPPSRLGLHNALLSYHDRVEILKSLGGTYECEVLVVEGEKTQLLTQELANKMFHHLPPGEVKWTTICEFLLPPDSDMPHTTVPHTTLPHTTLPQTAEPKPAAHEATSHDRQLHLFEYAHVPANDNATHHDLDIDA